MIYNYAVIDNSGKCNMVYKTTNCRHEKCHIPLSSISTWYLSKYYYPIPMFVDGDPDFQGSWYLDIEHTMEVSI